MPMPDTLERTFEGILCWHQDGRRLGVFACAVVFATSAVLAQDNQNEKRGFDAESLYSVGEIDTVNLFNAGLSMVIPIGQRYPLSTHTSYGFQLVYNSKLWDYRTQLVEPPATFHRIAIPTRVTNAGLGWTFNPGYFLEENGSSDVLHEWNHSQYVGPDGGQHYFYDQLHEGENDGEPDVWYTRDNTYLRLTKVNSSLYRIEFPNGEIHEFSYLLFDASTQWSKWFLTRIEDRHGNWMSISYGSRQGTWEWTIADQHGRSHTATLTYYPDVDDYYLTTVDLEAFDEARAVYSFVYEPDTIEQGCGATFPESSVDVRFLTSLVLPGSETYNMTEGGGHRYWTFCGGGARESGAIKGIRLPTRGQIEWTYSEFVLPAYFEHGSNAGPATSEVRGVRQRRTLDAAGNVIGTWNYRRELIPPPPYNPEEPRGREQRVHVEDPLGHCTTHYFDANPGYTDPNEDSNPFPGWSYSLPFSWQEPQSDGHHLSTQVYDSTDIFGHCDGTLLRSSHVLYEHDKLPPLSATPVGPIFEPWHETNRRVTSRRTLYHDDGTTFAETTSGDFDGVGHYRDSATAGNFATGNVRQETTDFNPGLGTYAVDQATNTSTGNFSPPATTAPWILGTFERQTVTEGAESATTTRCFDANGFLTRRRMFVGASEGADDVIAVFTPDADGNVASEHSYGGDLQSVGTGTSLCALDLPGAPEYEMAHQYAFGARPADGPAHDVTLAYAGVRQVARTRQVATGAGVETPSTFTEIHDRQGRLYRVVEPTGTQTTYGYDIGNRLSSVSMAGPVTQTRFFDYDNLGFLRSETHPEVGTSGNGAVTYSNYDTRGNAGQMADDGRTLDYAYDAAERLLTVTSTTEGLMKQFIYDTALARGLGKVHQAVRHNRVDIPGDGTSADVDVVVTETYDYAGVGGQVSSVLTTNSLNALDFLVSQTYDTLGRARDLTYPMCQGAPDCPSDSLVVRNTYSADYLVAVGVPGAPMAGASITYHPNGLWSTLLHANGVTTTQVNDPDSMRRPGRISVAGVFEGTPFDTGVYAYDGSGNVSAMGSDTFEYDLLGRLTDSGVHGWEQDFVYDAFGNITRVETTPPGGSQANLNLAVTAATNRLTAHGYDGSGNLTDFTGVWTQRVDPLNMAILRNPAPDAPSWLAIYTADDERLATAELVSGELVQHWTLRSPSGQILREFRHGRSGLGDSVFCDGFESGDTSGWSNTIGFNGQPTGHTRGVSCLGDSEWTVHTSYVYRGGELLADFSAGTVRHYHLDHLGSVRQITNQEADVAASYNYLPFGKEVDSNGAPLQFTGHERDSHLAGDTDDLDYMHARYYSPHLSRFTSVDPVLGDPAMPQSWNRYAYVLNSPINYTDPTGEAVDVIADVGFVVYDLGDIATTLIAGEGVSGTQLLSLGGDVIGVVVPFLTGVGAAVRVGSHADDVADGAKAAASLADDAPVVRGGIATPEQLNRGTGPHRDVPGLEGFSAQSRSGATVEELAATGGVGNGPFPHGKVSTSTVGQLRCAGCNVVPSPGAGANHATVVPGSASFERISNAFTVIPNPAR